MRDLVRPTITETLYLRKWAETREDGVLPDEIVVVETVTRPDEEPETTQRVVTTPDELMIINAQAEEAERNGTMAETTADPAAMDWKAEVNELEQRVKKHGPEGPAPNPKKLAAYRERLAHAKKQMASTPTREER